MDSSQENPQNAKLWSERRVPIFSCKMQPQTVEGGSFSIWKVCIGKGESSVIETFIEIRTWLTDTLYSELDVYCQWNYDQKLDSLIEDTVVSLRGTGMTLLGGIPQQTSGEIRKFMCRINRMRIGSTLNS